MRPTRTTWGSRWGGVLRFRAQYCVLLSCLSACATPRGGEIGPGYFLQAALGQLEISNRARPISEVLRDQKISSRTRKALASVASIKSFAESEGLRQTKNYEDYADLKRQAVVWVVSASEPLRLEVQAWKFPIVGSFTYLGWFDSDDGEAFRRSLSAAGYDADLRPARAYSTLGWFRDPLLSTMIPDDSHFGDLVEVVLHESVHASLHLKNQSTLNESIAQFLGEKLAIKYLESQGPQFATQLKIYQDSLVNDKKRSEVFRLAYRELEKVFSSKRSDQEKLEHKNRIFEKLRKDLQWPSERPLNNATLAQFSTYESSPEGLEALWRECGFSVARVFEAIATWSDRDDRIRTGTEIRSQHLDEALSKMKTQCRSL